MVRRLILPILIRKRRTIWRRVLMVMWSLSLAKPCARLRRLRMKKPVKCWQPEFISMIRLLPIRLSSIMRKSAILILLVKVPNVPYLSRRVHWRICSIVLTAKILLWSLQPLPVFPVEIAKRCLMLLLMQTEEVIIPLYKLLLMPLLPIWHRLTWFLLQQEPIMNVYIYLKQNRLFIWLEKILTEWKFNLRWIVWRSKLIRIHGLILFTILIHLRALQDIPQIRIV